MHALQAAEAACPGQVTLVTGDHAKSVNAAAATSSARIVHNRNFADGLGGSIACAVNAQADECNALIIMLADQPLVSAAHLVCMIERWSKQSNRIVATDAGGVVGPPVLFPRLAFAAMRKLSGDSGARAVLQDSQFETRFVECRDAAFDIDTREDLRALRER